MKKELYRRFRTQEAIDLEYNPVQFLDGADSYAKRWNRMAAREREDRRASERLYYGQRVEEVITLFPRRRSARGCIALLDSGVWGDRMLSPASLSLVSGLHRAGYEVAVISHGRAPDDSLHDVTRQVQSALALLMRSNDRGRGDRPFYVLGIGAAAHLAAMMCDVDWRVTFGIHKATISKLFLVSGVYDLTPLRFSWLQSSLQLSLSDCHALSPATQKSASYIPCQIIVGENDSAEYRRQSLTLFQHLSARQIPVTMTEIEQANMLSITDMVNEQSELVLEFQHEQPLEHILSASRVAAE